MAGTGEVFTGSREEGTGDIMTIQFGGLATGLDTNAIIDGLMNIERMPIARFEADKSWMNNRLTALTDFNSTLTELRGAAQALSNTEGLISNQAVINNNDYLSASASEEALPGTSYSVEVVRLASIQKSVSDSGFADKTISLGTGDLRITVGDTEHTIEITSGQDTLENIMTAINDADIGVTASIINDGSDSPYRLSLTGKDVATSFSINDDPAQPGDLDLGNFSITQPASNAEIIVDTITITGESNTIEDAIPGVTLSLQDISPGETTKVTINKDSSELSSTISSFAAAYNKAVAFVTSQSTINGSDGGILSGDSGLNSIKRHLQNMLTEYTDSGTFKALAELGFKTQKDATVNLDTSMLNSAISNDIDSVILLVAGNEEQDGIMDQFQSYLESMTSSSTGMLAGRQQSITSNISRIDDKIIEMEARLEKREETLRKQFTVMESLVSSMNAQSSFLTQQLSMISNLGSSRK